MRYRESRKKERGMGRKTISTEPPKTQYQPANCQSMSLTPQQKRPGVEGMLGYVIGSRKVTGCYSNSFAKISAAQLRELFIRLLHVPSSGESLSVIAERR